MAVEFVLEINIQTCTRGGYRRFIESLRVRLGERFSHNLPALPVQQEPPTRFFELVIRTNDHSVRFRLRMDNLYLIGYQMENGQWLEFDNDTDNNKSNKKDKKKKDKDKQQKVHLIREQGTTFLGFKCGYGAMARASHMNLDDVRVGFYNIGHGINQLATSEVGRTRAQYLIVVIMMFCEATRLIPVFEYMAANFDNSHGTSSSDYNAENCGREGQIYLWIMNMVRSWERSSAVLLRADAFPNEPSQNHFNIILIMGILLGLCYRPEPRRKPRMAFDEGERQCFLGLPLLQVFSVRIDNIDKEDPGDLYGTITVDDGLNIEYLYNRTSSNPESIRPGQNALLTGPSKSILAIGDFTIKLLLTDQDTFSWDDEIVNNDISWSSYEIGNLYDEPIFEKLDGTNGSVTVNYAVLRDAVAARITVTLEQGGEYTTNVYGEVSARYGNWKDDPNTTCLLFNRSRGDYVDVRRWGYIPLLRSVVAVPLDGSLIVTASLKDNDTFSGDDDIAIGTVEFPAEMSGTSSKQIKADGNGNWVTVTVYWSCQIDKSNAGRRTFGGLKGKDELR